MRGAQHQTNRLQDCPLVNEEDEEERKNANTITGRSPFTSAFKKVQGDLAKDEEDNPYFCPGIIALLFDSYLGISPLWSSLLLGNLQRYTSDR